MATLAVLLLAPFILALHDERSKVRDAPPRFPLCLRSGPPARRRERCRCAPLRVLTRYRFDRQFQDDEDRVERRVAARVLSNGNCESSGARAFPCEINPEGVLTFDAQRADFSPAASRGNGRIRGAKSLALRPARFTIRSNISAANLDSIPCTGADLIVIMAVQAAFSPERSVESKSSETTHRQRDIFALDILEQRISAGPRAVSSSAR